MGKVKVQYLTGRTLRFRGGRNFQAYNIQTHLHVRQKQEKKLKYVAREK
jgi:hypothetical protein